MRVGSAEVVLHSVNSDWPVRGEAALSTFEQPWEFTRWAEWQEVWVPTLLKWKPKCVKSLSDSSLPGKII